MSIKKYSVTDLILSPNQLNVLLILESPETNEFIHSHPIAGASGIRLSSFFKGNSFLHNFNEKDPLGCQIKRHNYASLGVMNASSLPLMEKFYPCEGLTNGDYRLIQHLNSIKIRLERKTQVNYQPKGIVEKYLVQNFSNRINHILNISNQPLEIIAFGHVSANFLKAINIQTFSKLRHPSARNGLGNTSPVVSKIQNLLP